MRSCFVIALLGLGAGYTAGLRPALAQTVKSASPLVAVKLLKVEPFKGHVGDSFTITGEGLSAGKTVEVFWSTVDAQYLTKVLVDNVEYHERSYQEKRVLLSSVTVDGQGRVSVRVEVPEDFGEVHDIHAVLDGVDVGLLQFQKRGLDA